MLRTNVVFLRRSGGPGSTKARAYGLFLGLGICLLPFAATGAPEVYSGLDPNPEATPVVEGARFAPEAIAPPRSETPSRTAKPADPPPSVAGRAIDKPKRNQSPQGRVAKSAVKTPRRGSGKLETEVASLRRQVERLQAELQQQKSAAISGSDACAPLKGVYDPVPSDQAESVARRLGLVARLILSHGRAYDYRTSTTRELREILSELEQPTASGKANASAAE